MFQESQRGNLPIEKLDEGSHPRTLPPHAR